MARAKGIDVSHWLENIDFSKVATAGIEFVFIKATEGTSFVDSKYALNFASASANNIYRSAYHFFRSNISGTAQATHFLDISDKGDLPDIVDLETVDSTSNATRLRRLHDFLLAVEDSRQRKPLIYSNYYFVRDRLSPHPSWLTDYDLWIANYTTASQPSIPLPYQTWKFWQYTSTGKVSGISGNVDLNWFNGTTEELQMYIRGGGDPLPPPDCIPVQGSVTASALNVRAGPGTNYSVIKRLIRNEIVTIYDINQSWVKISLDSSEWIHSYYLSSLTFNKN